jgi:amino acid transporter, AAT family
MLFSLARGGWAPAPLGRLNAAGSPRLALVASSYGIVVAVVLEKWAPKNAFVYILTGALFGLMLSWLVSLAAHISFRRRTTSAQIAALPMRSPLGAWGSALGLTLVTAAVLKTWWDSRVSLISGLSTLLILTVAYLFLRSGDAAT